MGASTTYKVEARRSGAWWALEVPEAPGVFTQARRLDLAAAVATEAIALFLDVDETAVDVELVPVLEHEDGIFLREFEDRRALARHANADADAAAKVTARALVNDGLRLRDVAVVMHLTFQRIHQLVNGPPPTCYVCGAPGTWEAGRIKRHDRPGDPTATRELDALVGRCSVDRTHWHYPGPTFDEADHG